MTKNKKKSKKDFPTDPVCECKVCSVKKSQKIDPSLIRSEDTRSAELVERTHKTQNNAGPYPGPTRIHEMSVAPQTKEEIDSSPIQGQDKKKIDEGDMLPALNGYIYATQMVMLLFTRSLFKNLKDFRLETEVRNVGKFDDIVFDEGGQKFWIIQLKHFKYQKLYPQNILSVDDQSDLQKPFKLLKYVYSYVQAERKLEFSKGATIKRAALITNVPKMDLNEENEMILLGDTLRKRKQTNIKVKLSEIVFKHDDLIHFPGNKVKYYKFNDPNLVPILVKQHEELKYQEGRELIHLTQENIIEALEAIVYCVGQPSDEDLKNIIKNEIQTHFRVSSEKTESLFNDLQVSISDWLCYKNHENGPRKLPQVLTFDEAQRFFQTRLKQVSFGIELPSKCFVGRKHDLTMINYRLNTCGRVLITGVPGAGKTDLVRKFINIHGKDKHFGRVLWIDATNNTTIKFSFKRLADQLCLKNDGIPVNLLIQYFLSEYFYNLKTLFVFDDFQINEDDPLDYRKEIKDCIVKNCGPDFILISDDLIPELDIPYVKLEPLEKPDVLNLIKLHIQDFKIDVDDEKSLEIISEVNKFYPLGLNLVLKFIRSEYNNLRYFKKHQTVEDLLVELVNKRKYASQTYSNVLESFNSYEKSTFILLHIIIERIKEESNGTGAISVLKMLAFIYANKINSNIFLPLFGSQSHRAQLIELSSTIKLINRYCVVKVNSKGLLSIHPLLQKFLRIKFLTNLNENSQKQLLANIMKVILWDETLMGSNLNDIRLNSVVNKYTQNKCDDPNVRLHLSALYKYFVQYSDLLGIAGIVFDEYRTKFFLKYVAVEDMTIIGRILRSKESKIFKSTLVYLVKTKRDNILKFLIEEAYIDIQSNPLLGESLLYLAKKFKNTEMEKYLTEAVANNQIARETNDIIECLMSQVE